MTPVRLLISDVDGTLVTTDKELSPATIAAVRRLRRAGIGFTAVSSRPPFGMRMLVPPLELTLPMGAFNGSTIFNPDGTLLECHAIPPQGVGLAVGFLAARGVDIWLYTNERWLVTRPDTAHVAHERHTIATAPEVVGDMAPFRDGICKIVGISDDPGMLTACEPELEALLGDTAQVSRSQTYYIDITPTGFDKGTFVSTVAEQLGIAPAEVAVLGDMPNDLPMFSRSGVSFAMGNATDEVKARATDTTASNDEDGVAAAIGKLLALS